VFGLCSELLASYQRLVMSRTTVNARTASPLAHIGFLARTPRTSVDLSRQAPQNGGITRKRFLCHAARRDRRRFRSEG